MKKNNESTKSNALFGLRLRLASSETAWRKEARMDTKNDHERKKKELVIKRGNTRVMNSC
jgi:hypothetical protein